MKLSEHVISEIRRRKLSRDRILEVASEPQQTVPARHGLECRQSKFQDLESEKEYLLRVIVNPAKSPNVIVTAYKTSKIEKYWRVQE